MSERDSRGREVHQECLQDEHTSMSNVLSETVHGVDSSEKESADGEAEDEEKGLMENDTINVN